MPKRWCGSFPSLAQARWDVTSLAYGGTDRDTIVKNRLARHGPRKKPSDRFAVAYCVSSRTAKLSSKSSKRSDARGAVRLIPLGRLVNTHGVRGELRLLPYAFPCSTLQKGLTVFLQGKTGPACAYTVESVRPHAPFVLVRL